MFLRRRQFERASLQQFLNILVAEHRGRLGVNRLQMARRIDEGHPFRQDFDQPAVMLFAGPQRCPRIAQPHECSNARANLIPVRRFDDVIVRPNFQTHHPVQRAGGRA